MKVLVTGHKGFIGTAMVPLLVKAGYDVSGIDSDLYRSCTYSGEILEVPSLTKDIRDVELSDLSGIDVIVHLAALSNDPLGNINPDLTYDINYRATIKLAELAKKAGVSRFIFASSCSMYGKAGDTPLDETAEFNPITPYAKSKVLVEKDLSAMATDKFSPVFLRNATAYGVSPRIRFDLVINNLVAWAFSTGKVHMKSDGTPWRPLVHIQDITQAVLCSLKAPQETIHNLAVNVGFNEENYQMQDLADLVHAIVPNCVIEYAENAGPDDRSYRVNFDKIQNVFPDFKSNWSAKRGIQECYDLYVQYGLDSNDYEGIKFNRIAHIESLLKTGKLNADLRWI